jgi:hypothetical protein
MEYLEYNKIKVIISNIIPRFINTVSNDRGLYYSLSDEGICLVDDILNNYEIVYRSFIEKHKLNEAF